MIQAYYDSFLQQSEKFNENITKLIEILDASWIDLLFEPTTVVAGIVAIIVFMQWHTSEKQRKQEIFEKRWDLYSRVSDLFYQKQILKQKISEEYFLLCANEASFLFDKKVAKHIMDICSYDKEGLDYDWLNKPFKKYMRIG